MAHTNIAGVQFQRAGKIYDYFYKNIALQVGDQVLVDSPKGEAVARVSLLKFEYIDRASEQASDLRRVLRIASSYDTDANHYSGGYPDDYPDDKHAKSIADKTVRRLGLKMEITQCHVQGMGKKILIFFTAPERVDFRGLVRELASEFKARIELRQIGPRDQAKLTGGIGICGREYCCSSFLREFVPVSIKMAKNQNLALIPNQVSGGCGRLLCCLSYENDVYAKLRAELPGVGRSITHKLSGEKAVVIGLDVLNQRVTVRLESGGVEHYPVAELLFTKGGARQKKRSKGKGSAPADWQWGEDLDVVGLVEFNEQLQSQKKSQPSR